MFFRRGVSPEERDAKARIDEEYHRLTRHLTGEIERRMREFGLTPAELGARMGVSEKRISQILGGDENLTLQTLSARATALDARFEFDIEFSTSEAGDTHVGPGDAGALRRR